MRRIQALWLSLLKNIFLGVKPDGGRQSSFIAGQDSRIFFGGITITWWRSELGDRIAKRLGSMYVENFSSQNYYEVDHVVDLIFKALKERCLDENIFSGVLAARSGTLFERIKCSHDDAAGILDLFVREGMQSECGKWFLIYPLFRVTGHLNMLGFERLTFAPKNDVEFWAKVNRHENFGNDWDPNTGCFNDGRGIGFRSEKFHSWLVGAYEGSKQEAKANFRREAQEAMACIFAFSSQKNRRHRVAAIASDDCLMLRSDVSIREYEFSTLGHLYPCYADELELLSIADEVIEWNRLRAILPLASRRRLGTALCFTNLAMSSNDVSTYIFYFIALDALFGERGRVEVSLTEGVSRVCSISRSHEKIGWLFDLRNELIHGGSRYENEWPRYPKYVKHFESKPLLDLEEITLECLRRYPLLQ